VIRGTFAAHHEAVRRCSPACSAASELVEQHPDNCTSHSAQARERTFRRPPGERYIGPLSKPAPGSAAAVSAIRAVPALEDEHRVRVAGRSTAGERRRAVCESDGAYATAQRVLQHRTEDRSEQSIEFRIKQRA